MNVFQQFGRKFSFALSFVRQGDLVEVSSILKTKVWSSREAFGVMRDMSIPFPSPTPLIPISIRPARPDDIRQVLNVDEPGIALAERRDRVARQHLMDAGFSYCFVAVTSDDRPCYIQWLIMPSENRLLAQSFGGLFPPLAAHEALLEGAYTPAAFRGQRIMPAAMALLAEKGAEMGATSVLTFVGEENIASLKGCKRAGFAPYRMRRAVYRFGRRRLAFWALPEGTPYPFDNVPS
jgi:hypothetical protein